MNPPIPGIHRFGNHAIAVNQPEFWPFGTRFVQKIQVSQEATGNRAIDHGVLVRFLRPGTERILCALKPVFQGVQTKNCELSQTLAPRPEIKTVRLTWLSKAIEF